MLKSASTAVVGLGISTPATATKHGSTNYSEVRIVHDVSTSTSDLTYPFIHLDEHNSRIVDEEQSALYINEQYAEEKLNFAKQKENIVAEMDFLTPPVTFGSCPESTLLTNIDNDFRGTQLLSISGDYQKPPVSVFHQQNKMVVEASGRETRVGAEEESELLLPEKDITVKAYKTVEKDDDEVTIAGGEDWQKPWRIPNVREYSTETVTVTPRVVTKNYGELDIMGVRSKAPKYHPNR